MVETPSPATVQRRIRAAGDFFDGRITEAEYTAIWNATEARERTLRGELPAKVPKWRTRPAPSASDYYARASEAFNLDPRIRTTAKDLGLLLIRLCRGRTSCDGWIDQFADLLGCSARTVQRAQRRLEACGYIRVEHVREGRINDANRYHLLPAILPSLAPRRGKRGGDKLGTPRGRDYVPPPRVPPEDVGDEKRSAPRAAPPPAPPRHRGGVAARQRDGATAVPRRRCTGPP